jgi:hypothetical protein
MARIHSIPCTDPDSPPLPPTSGRWMRGEDGSLTPRDEATARTAGLFEEDPAPPAQPDPEA